MLSYPISIESEGKPKFHAAGRIMALYIKQLLKHWERTGYDHLSFSTTACPDTLRGRQTKIALRCSDEEEMLLLQATAQSLNLCARSIQDA